MTISQGYMGSCCPPRVLEISSGRDGGVLEFPHSSHLSSVQWDHLQGVTFLLNGVLSHNQSPALHPEAPTFQAEVSPSSHVLYG
jgi:hypothetical protein